MELYHSQQIGCGPGGYACIPHRGQQPQNKAALNTSYARSEGALCKVKLYASPGEPPRLLALKCFRKCTLGRVMRYVRGADGRIHDFSQIYPALQPGELLAGAKGTPFEAPWKLASSSRFAPAPEGA